MTRVFLVGLGLLLVVHPVRAENWPEFRGPTGQGMAPGKLPTQWSADKNVVWKQPIPGKGWSSPIILDGRIYLTTAVVDDAKKELSLRALCLDAKDGKTVWDREVFRGAAAAAPRIHTKNSHASPTPLTDGTHVYVHFGHQGTACLDLQGNIVWKTAELAYRPVHGNGGTPILVDDILFFSCDGGDKQLVAALDKKTGKVAWKTDRKATSSKKFAFSTPLAIAVKDQKQIVSPGASAVCAYDPKTGKELWRVQYGEGYSVVPRPAFGHGLVFLSSGFDTPNLLAIKVDGAAGDVTDSHVAWTMTKAAPLTPSPLLVGDELYVISDLGIATCLDAKTGKVHWQERIGGNHSASPLFADGKVYFQSEEGVGVVVKAGPKFEEVARNRLGEPTLASYAVADGALYIRTDKHLYRIETK